MSMESIAEQVKAHIAKLTQILRLIEELDETPSEPVKQAGAPTGIPKRTVSASARRKMAAAQRARWKKIRAGKK